MNTQVDLPANIENQKIAEIWSSFISNRATAILDEVYHEHAVTWHNYDGKNMTMPEIRELVGVIFSTFKELSFNNVRRFITETGFVQQHDIVGTHVNGAKLNAPACVVVTINNGKISRLEEYIDPAPVFALLSAN